jgi:hypothetical protein
MPVWPENCIFFLEKAVFYLFIYLDVQSLIYGNYKLHYSCKVIEKFLEKILLNISHVGEILIQY